MDLRAKTCCFTGHRSLSHKEKLKVAVRLRRVIEEQMVVSRVMRKIDSGIWYQNSSRILMPHPPRRLAPGV